MNNVPIITQPWYEVQRRRGQVNEARQSVGCPHIPSDYVLVAIRAAGLCQADTRIVTGNKASHSDPNQHVTLGHEGVGVVLAYGSDVVGYKEGDYVVILPHIHRSDVSCPSGQVNPSCIGLG